MAGGPYADNFSNSVGVTILDDEEEIVSECCAGEWDEDTGICLVCKDHAKGVVLGA